MKCKHNPKKAIATSPSTLKCSYWCPTYGAFKEIGKKWVLPETADSPPPQTDEDIRKIAVEITTSLRTGGKL